VTLTCVCPDCGSHYVSKDGTRVYQGVRIQRFLCSECDLRFSDPCKRIKSNVNTHDSSHLCALKLKGAKKMGSTAETKTAGDIEKNQQYARGKIVEFCLYLQRQNYAEETIRLNRIALQVLMDRGADLFNTDTVKDTIAKQKWSANRRRNVIIAYTNFLKQNRMIWEPPRNNVTETIPFIPTEQEIDCLISAAPKKLSAFLQLIKETAMRRGEAKRIRWIDVNSEQNTITLNEPEKRSNARLWKVTPRLMAQLNALEKTSERVFGDCRMDTLKGVFLKLRKKQAAKLQNPRLLKIGFHTIRHWKATMLYHQTKDPFCVRDFLGHRSMKNTEKYVNIERKMFANYDNDEFTVKVVSKTEEVATLLEQGFEWVGQKDNLIFLKKRK